MYMQVTEQSFRPTPVAFAIQRTVGIPTECFDRAATVQESPSWCWVTAPQMVHAYYGFHISQQELVSRRYRIPRDVRGSDDDITASLNVSACVDTGNGIVGISVHGRRVGGPPSPRALIRELSQGRPVIVTFMADPLVGHAVVITAVDYLQAPQGPMITSLSYRDPSPTLTNWINRGRVPLVEPDLSRFYASIRAHWLTSASRKFLNRTPW